MSLFTNLDFNMDEDTCEKIGSCVCGKIGNCSECQKIGSSETFPSDKETEGQTDNSEEQTTDDDEENAETMVHSVEQNSGKGNFIIAKCQI